MSISGILRLAAAGLWAACACAAAPDEKGLAGEWKFDEGAGAIARDSSGMKNDASIIHAEWAKGKRGYGLEFDGSQNDSATCPASPVLDASGDIAASAWIKLAAPSENRYNCILSKGNAAKGAGYYLRAGTGAEGSVQFVAGDGKGGCNSVWGKYEWDGSFHHVAAAVSGQTVSIYVDGEKIAEKRFAAAKLSDSSSSQLVIGRGFRGIIDDVKIYDRALSADSIEKLAAGSPGLQRPKFPLTVLAVRAKAKMDIDANLNEWTSSCPVFLDNPTIQATHYNLWDDPALFNAAASFMFDGKALYLAACVNDKSIHCDNAKQADMVELRIKRPGQKDTALFLMPKSIDGSRCRGENIDATQVEAAARITDKGYVIEAKIPFAALKLSQQDIAGSDFQLAVHDAEQGGEGSMIMRSLCLNGESGHGSIMFLTQLSPEADSMLAKRPACAFDRKFYGQEDRVARMSAAIPPPYNDSLNWIFELFDKKGKCRLSQKIALPQERSIVPTEICVDIPLDALDDGDYYGEFGSEDGSLKAFKAESRFTIAKEKGTALKNFIDSLKAKTTQQGEGWKIKSLRTLLDSMAKYYAEGDYPKAGDVEARVSAALKSGKAPASIPWSEERAPNWESKRTCGRDFHYFIPWDWEFFKMAGIDKEPFIVNGAFFNKSADIAKDPSGLFGKPGSESVKRLLSMDNPVMMKANDAHPNAKPFTPQYRQAYEFCKSSFGGRFMGTFIVMGEMLGGHPNLWSEKTRQSLEELYKRKIEMPRNRDEAYEYVKMVYMAKLNGEKYTTVDLPTSPNLNFFNKIGIDLCIPEIGGWEYCTPLQLASARGAARQYGRAWGTYIASYQKGITAGGDSERMYDHLFPWTRKCSASNRYDFGPCSGTSLSLMKRMLYASYMSGANFVFKEGVADAPGAFVANYDCKREYGADEWLPTLLQDKQWHISELGALYKEMYDSIVTNPARDRGVAYAPIALLFDRHHGALLCRRPDKIYENDSIPLETADYMERSVNNTVFPFEEIPQGQTYEAKTMVTGPFGDVFDMLDNDASQEVLQNYPAIFLAGNVTIDSEFAKKLKAYAMNGGILVANVRQLNQELPPSFFGCKLLNERGQATESLSLADYSVVKERNPFSYEKVAMEGSAFSAMDAIGDTSPLLVVNRQGAGMTILSTPPYLMDMKAKNKMLNIFSHLMKDLSRSLVPIEISGDSVECIIGKSKNGYVATLINNDGVRKHAGKREVANCNEAKKVKVTFKKANGGKCAVTEWLNNQTLNGEKTARGLEVNCAVPPGDVRILEFKTN